MQHSPYTHKPDLDNLVKWICDAASNNVLYHDDAIIASIATKKLYDYEPRTIFTISEIDG